jgi:hypothetical protein
LPGHAMLTIVPGTPRYAVWAAWLAVLSVLPSAAWRTSIGFGARLGTSDGWRHFQDLPGSGTWYVLGLSIASLSAASLTFGLVQPWGERIPAWVPGLGGRAVPTALAVTVALAGATSVIVICALSVIAWDKIIRIGGPPTAAGYALAVAAYAPALRGVHPSWWQPGPMQSVADPIGKTDSSGTR